MGVARGAGGSVKVKRHECVAMRGKNIVYLTFAKTIDLTSTK